MLKLLFPTILVELILVNLKAIRVGHSPPMSPRSATLSSPSSVAGRPAGTQGRHAPSADLIRRFDIAGPRYTSYPTADRFVEAFGATDYERWLDIRAQSVVKSPLSVYAHIPFCQSVCYYCACNKIATRDRSRGTEYVDDLLLELKLYTDRIGSGHPVSQMHLGGGTPTFLERADMRRLIEGMEHALRFTSDAERSIEIDPRTIDIEGLRELRDLGFNRVSFGVQDFDPAVQASVHRVQSTEQVFSLTRAAREIGFTSINVDLIHGLPRQNLDTFRQTLETLADLRPDRVAVYGYAHLPERFKPQRRINVVELPPAADKLEMMRLAIDFLADHGYEHIGLDHFALPDDALATAQRMGLLHRNFMGYTTQPDCDMLGLGVSAIGRVGPTYGANARTLEAWRDAVRGGTLPIDRGFELNRDDMLRRFVIMSMMCNGSISFSAIERDYLVEPAVVFRDEIDRMREMQSLGLVTVDKEGITATPLGRFFVRPIAMAFDRYLRTALTHGKYSRVL